MWKLVLLVLALATTACGGDNSSAGAAGAAGAAGGAEMAQAAAHPGEGTYNKFCISCHGMGTAGAPRLGDAAAWAPRAAKGMDALLATTISGIGAMPAKGLCRQCSDEDLRQSIDYMLGESK